MKRTISKILIVTMVFSVLCFYEVGKGGAAKVQAAGGKVVTTTPQATTTTVPETTTAKKKKKKKVVKKTPAKVKKLKITRVTTSSLRVSWKKSKLATKYIVYRAKEGMSKYKKYKEITQTSFFDTGLGQGKVYKYKVKSYRKADGYVTKSGWKYVKAMTKLRPIKSFKAKAGRHKVVLKWKKNSKASKYYLYRASEKNGRCSFFKKIKTISKKNKTYTDYGLSSGKAYKYMIRAYKKKSGIKRYTPKKITTVVTSLSTPWNLSANRKKTQITLKWNQVPNAEKYEVYKGDKLIKVTSKLKYTKKKLKKKHKYSFKVRAVREFEEKTYKSAFVSITVKTKGDSKKRGHGTYVEISIKKQLLKMYVKDKLYVKTPVVTGNVGARHTSKGTHHVMEKTANRTLSGSYGSQSWNVKVNYWLKFTGDGQGIHDSTWRSSYGGSIYKYNGSHGCVNTPLGPMRKIFKKAYVGMPVIVY